ncbi:MAG: hypothetical protein KAR79_01995 [Simkaniaceae bacterium]|nr:hypothetical protein [Simkaniaceae bacterium]
MESIIYPLSWVAISILSISYWFQIWQIHVHREVRDISLTYNVLLAIGFATLGITAYFEGSTIFIVKQIVTTVPVIVIIGQVIYHRSDSWHDPKLPLCSKCSKEIERRWHHCPECGQQRD